MADRSALIAAGELLLAAALWGFGFIAAVWALEVLNAFEITLVRFALAAAVGAACTLAVVKVDEWRGLTRLSFWPALLLVATLVFQTWGLKYTTATKCGFITTLYVVFVPVLDSALRRRSIPWSLWACVVTALFGTGLIVNVGIAGALNLGDLLTFVAALFATVQIYLVGRIGPHVKRPFAFNTAQSAWAVLITLPFLFQDGLVDKLSRIGEWPWTAIGGIASLAFGSTALAFFLQVKAQATLSPTVAALLCLLESPFAMVFAFALLHESLGPFETAGAVLIFASAVLATYLESVTLKKKH